MKFVLTLFSMCLAEILMLTLYTYIYEKSPETGLFVIRTGFKPVTF